MRFTGSETTSKLDNDVEVELQKQAVIAIGRRSKDEAVPILILTARNAYDLLPTIRSRAVPFHFARLSNAEMDAFLKTVTSCS